MEEALSAPGSGAVPAGVPEQLASAGLEALGRVVRASREKSQSRETASELLAADALLTYACQAAAEAGPDALEELLEWLSPERFSALLERATP